MLKVIALCDGSEAGRDAVLSCDGVDKVGRPCFSSPTRVQGTDSSSAWVVMCICV